MHSLFTYMETLQLQEITVLQQQINLCTSLAQYLTTSSKHAEQQWIA